MAIVLDGSTGISSIGTLTGVTSISSTTADTPVILQDSSSNSNTCRAWVNFDGTTNVGGFCTIRADFNVSSVTDNGTGNYTVNFTTAMPDANYTFVGSVARDTVTGISTINDATTGTKSTTAFQITTQRSGSANDYAFIWCVFFR
jgi:hypothetical protein